MAAVITAPLKGKYAVVTGGSRGIGAAIALQLAKKGISGIAITYLSAESLANSICSDITTYGSKAVAIQGDILSPTFGEDVVQAALRALNTSHLDIIVNNAGLAEMKAQQPFTDTTLDGFQKMLLGNVFAPISIIRAALPHLPPYGGRVINISSVTSREPNIDPVMTYGASKAALDSFTRSLASRYAAEKHATFNSVSVGPTTTDALKTILDKMPAEIIEQFKMKQTAEHRFGTPEEVAMIVGFLASDESRWINGASVPANGGSLIVLQG